MTPERFAQALEATWPPAAVTRAGPFRLLEGLGGGKRVSAATLEGPFSQADLDAAQAAMAVPLFLIRPEDRGLDAALAARGYALVDPVVSYHCPVGALEAPTWLSSFPHWPPLQIALDIWAQGHIGPARIAVMARVRGPKAAILARMSDRPAGVAFVACDGDLAMLHALEVSPAMRRRGVAEATLRAAAAWARDAGARDLALIVTEANAPARALYAKLGMRQAAGYHYRVLPG